ncbi:MAG: hypothetical protein ACRDKG_10510 [Actinomycetota bacterium]
MKRFAGKLLLINAIVALAIGLIGWSSDWNAADYTLALLVVCGVAFFATAAALGSSGPMSNVSGGAMTDAIGPGRVIGAPEGFGGMAVDDVAISEHVQSHYSQGPDTPKGDFYGRRRARQGEHPGPRPLFLMLATSLMTGAAALISWKLFE